MRADERSLDAKAGPVKLKMEKLRKQAVETASSNDTNDAKARSKQR